MDRNGDDFSRPGVCTVQIECKACGLPFVFSGMPSASETENEASPYTSNGATKLHLMVRPAKFD